MPPNDRIEPDTQYTEDWELFLLGMRYRGSRLEKLSGNEPFLLSGSDNAWLIHNGMVDVFAVQTADGEAVGARNHFFRAQRYHLLLGQDLSAHDVGLLAVCAPETEILRFKAERLQQQLEKPENIPIIAQLLETWVRALSSGLQSDVRPKEFKRIQAGEPLTMQAGDIVRAGRDVLWVRHVDGRSRFLGRQDHEPLGDRLLPVSDRAWIQSADDCELHASTTSDLLQEGHAWDHVRQFDALLLELVARDIERGKASTSQMIHEKASSDEQRLDTAFRQLASTWDARLTQGLIGMDSADPLLSACDLVGRAMDITIKSPPDYDGTGIYTDSLVEIARASQIRTRMVLLRDDWWRRDNGPLLAYRTQGDKRYPVALIPTKPGQYELHDPSTREVLPVDHTLAEQINSTAYTFYRPFPNRPLNAWDLIRFGQRSLTQDMLNLLLIGMMGGLLGLVVPIITGILFDSIIPSGDTEQLLVLGGVLAVSAVATLLFQVARGITLLRIEGRMDSSIHAALWDRVLNLPTDFFRRYSAGDLTERTIGLLTIKQVLSGSVPLALLSGIFSGFNLLVMFAYDAQLALIALGIVTLSVVIVVLLGLRFLRYQREVARHRGELSGVIAQLVGGISKLRVAGAENRAFYLWANAFSEQKKLAFKAQSVRNTMTVFYTVYPTLAAMMIFATVYNNTTLSTGAFLAFNAAFVQFLAAALQLGAALVTVLSVVPLYERLKPILQLRPEVDEQKAHPGELTGAIEVNHVSFRYHKEGPLILDDVTFNVEPGEFVALVGASGSGKSTLLRHLLGFETPDSGALYYDGQALAEVDLRAVRRQIGVVLQHSQVITGTILDNITGSTGLTVNDAWAAVRQAGIEDDIKQMPMGMQTYISEGGSTFSGGQRQRLLIARALVTHPRIIFFDEATSALDDKAQSQVTESLKQVDATRIVIAHRLSTIVDADRILVMERGQVVERGTYKELLELRGVFAKLAERQLI